MIYKTSTLLIVLMLMSGISLNAQSNTPQTEDCCKVKPVLIDGSKSQITDTIRCRTWNSTNETWEPNIITVCSYDEHGRLVTETHKYWIQDSEMFSPAAKIIRTWYETDSLKTRERYNWNPDLSGGDWDPSFSIYCEFNDDGLRNYVFSQYSQYGSMEWYHANKEFIYHNTAGLIDSVITQYWNSTQNQWYYSYRYRNYYDDDFNLTEVYHDYANNPEGDFALNNRWIYQPGFMENQTQEIKQYISLGEWKNSERHLVNRNSQGLKSTDLFQQWNVADMMWDTLVMQKETFEYYENGLLKEHRLLSYYLEWVNVNRNISEYDDAGNAISKLTQDWDFYYEVWKNDELCTYPEPQTITAFNDLNPENDATITLAPNPASGFVGVLFADKMEQPYRVELLNHAGQRIESIDNASEISLGNYSSGVYLVKITSPEFRYVKKLVIE